MESVKTTINRRSFLKVSALAGGGMMLSFSWLAGCNPSAPEEVATLPKEWFELNSYIKIADNGLITLMAPNPEFGSNVKTSLPMMVAEELDIDWKDVMVEQADFFPERYDRQFTGGSLAMQMAWKPLRTAGATARHMLIAAAAQAWQVPAGEITTENGMLHHKGSSKKASYGEMASKAAGLEVPKEVPLKNVKDFKIIGNSKRNVEGVNIVTGKPLFTLDYKREGMLIAMIAFPPAFGLKVKSVDDGAVKAMPGIKDVFTIKTLADDYERNFFDTTSFTELVVVVGNTTWEVMNAKKALKVEWEKIADTTIALAGRGGSKQTVTIPAGLESTEGHLAKMAQMAKKPGKELRKDGDPEGVFKKATKVIERTYTAPFLAHNAMEPVNCFAHVTAEKAEIVAPIQAPEIISQTLVARLGLPKEKIHIKLARMGGGFGQRAYGHHLVEAAVISQKLNAPVKLVYTREDDMTYGIYRPTYTATYKAALDENNNMIAYQVKAGGIPESPLGFSQNRFPAGAVDNYLAEEWVINSNITIGAFRAPRSNFLGAVEQAFLDEVAQLAGKDPIEFRLELLERAKKSPVGKQNDYDPDRYAGVLKLVRDKSNWKGANKDVHRGVAAYFCHNTYVAEVVDLSIKENKPVVEKVFAAVDCGIVVNPDAAANMGEGAIIDGIGNALYGEMTFKDGVPQKNNFHNYRMIRHSEAPKSIEVHFVKNDKDPTGLGEPLFPPIFAALANAIYKATGKREYSQPFLQGKGPLV
ncbi:molybdopterin-dependent oxidoreductase [Rhodocytophaga aerolata]|uniref:Molybdopterin-dependent oxidoreductase n=1 Tax=Rhodocytophaga aerolata TaxID=455078 RepID=A0ABT8RAX0_9BACT|nr:molybdopterin cofactor-binding domain-containing protein [Rhodocytophaga aerolata]MDO1449253.1 molybdopterin-dependent oxidoreductase [Rhodocytophaga aerolata]